MMGLFKLSTLTRIGKELAKLYLQLDNTKGDLQREAIKAEIATYEAQAQIAANSKEVKLATATFWEVRLLTFLTGLGFALHALFVCVDSIFQFTWDVAALPKPYDEYQGVILLSFFGVFVIDKTVSGLVAAVFRRRNA